MKNETQFDRIYEDLCQQMRLVGGINNLISTLKHLQVCILIANCDEIIKSDQNVFQEELMNFTSKL